MQNSLEFALNQWAFIENSPSSTTSKQAKTMATFSYK